MGVYQNGSAPLIWDVFGIETTPGDFSTFVPTNPTTVTYYLRDPDGTVTPYVFGVDPEVTNPSVGRFELRPGALNLAGLWTYRAEGTGAVVAICEGDLTILPSSVLTPVVSEPVNGPCQLWCDPQDIVDCSNLDLSSDTSILESAAASASEILYQLSGRIYNGRCTQTVRPCSDGCGCWPYQFMPGLSIGAPQVPLGWTGGWGFWGSGWGWGGDHCGCSPLSRALLPGYPVTSITEVKIDGVVLAADEYRLDEWRWLTRMADSDGNAQFWPGCQRLDLPDTEEGTWSCTYVHGVTPPETGKRAAAQLGGYLYQSCMTGDCTLPVGATQVTRQGITVAKAPFISWTQINGRWATGLPLVDAFLSSVNKKGVSRRPIAWAPGAVPYARKVGV